MIFLKEFLDCNKMNYSYYIVISEKKQNSLADTFLKIDNSKIANLYLY